MSKIKQIMKKILLFLFLSFLGISSSLSAQNVDDIINKYLSAVGGVDKLTQLKSIIMEGKINANGAEIPVTMTRSNLKGFRFDINVMGMTGWVIMTPDSGWVFMPFQGQTKPEAMPGDAIKEGVDQLDLSGSLCNYKAKGHTIEYIGLDDVEGTECHKLKVTHKSGNITYFLIDPASNYIVRTITKQKAGGKEMDIISDFSNYKPVDGGLIFPFTIASQNGPIEFQKITINSEIPENTFKPIN